MRVTISAPRDKKFVMPEDQATVIDRLGMSLRQALASMDFVSDLVWSFRDGGSTEAYLIDLFLFDRTPDLHRKIWEAFKERIERGNFGGNSQDHTLRGSFAKVTIFNYLTYEGLEQTCFFG